VAPVVQVAKRYGETWAEPLRGGRSFRTAVEFETPAPSIGVPQ